jgi:hypothetical protein
MDGGSLVIKYAPPGSGHADEGRVFMTGLLSLAYLVTYIHAYIRLRTGLLLTCLLSSSLVSYIYTCIHSAADRPMRPASS